MVPETVESPSEPSGRQFRLGPALVVLALLCTLIARCVFPPPELPYATRELRLNGVVLRAEARNAWIDADFRFEARRHDSTAWEVLFRSGIDDGGGEPLPEEWARRCGERIVYAWHGSWLAITHDDGRTWTRIGGHDAWRGYLIDTIELREDGTGEVITRNGTYVTRDHGLTWVRR